MISRSVLSSLVFLSFVPASMAQEAPYQDPGMKKIVQIAIVCRDAEASAKRWAALLGVQPPKPDITRPGSEVNLIYRGKPSNSQLKVAYFALDGQPALELMEPVGGDTAWKEHLDQYGESVHHVAFQVEDVERTIKTLEGLGYPVIHRGRFAAKGARRTATTSTSTPRSNSEWSSSCSTTILQANSARRWRQTGGFRKLYESRPVCGSSFPSETTGLCGASIDGGRRDGFVCGWSTPRVAAMAGCGACWGS